MRKKNKNKDAAELAVFPSTGEGYRELSGEDVAELSRNPQGKLWEKHILNKGTLLHPVTGAPINIDDAFVQKLKKNFEDKVCDIVQVPLVNDNNKHVEDPDRNLGEVVDIRERDGKVYAVIDGRDERASKFGKTYIGASAMLSTNYKDTRTGKLVGPTLLHVAVTNRPYVTGLEDYQEIVAASNTDGTLGDVVVYSSPEMVNEDSDNFNDEAHVISASATTQETNMTLEEALAALKADHGIDVPVLQAENDVLKNENEALKVERDEATALSNTLSESLADVLKEAGTDLELSNGEVVDTNTVIGAIVELASANKAYDERVQKLERAAAVTEVDALIAEGRIIPAKKDVMVELKLSQPDTFDAVVPEQPVIKLSDEKGNNPGNDQKRELDIDAEVARLSAQFEEKTK